MCSIRIRSYGLGAAAFLGQPDRAYGAGAFRNAGLGHGAMLQKWMQQTVDWQICIGDDGIWNIQNYGILKPGQEGKC